MQLLPVVVVPPSLLDLRWVLEKRRKPLFVSGGLIFLMCVDWLGGCALLWCCGVRWCWAEMGLEIYISI